MNSPSSPHEATRSTSWAGTVVICGANNWDGPRFADRQLAERLAQARPVLYVDRPLSPVTVARRRAPSNALRPPWLRVLGPRLARLTPIVVPGMERPLVAPSTRVLVAAGIRRAMGRLHGTIGTVIDTSCLAPVLDRFGPEPVRIYWAQDDMAGLAELLGQDVARVRRGERRIAAAADVVIAANPRVAAALEREGHHVELVPYGCDSFTFARATSTAPAHDVVLEPPLAGFMGHIGDRIDLDLLEAVARRGVSLLLVGPLHPHYEPDRFHRLVSRPTVSWIGPRTFEDLPSYLAAIRVGLVPYTTGTFNVGSFPLKMLEYLAAGLPVVATDLPAVRWLNASKPLITIAERPEAFADAVVEALSAPVDDHAAAQRQAFAAEHSWERRAERVVEIIDSARVGLHQRS